jgi:hypothetical protein
MATSCLSNTRRPGVTDSVRVPVVASARAVDRGLTPPQPRARASVREPALARSLVRLTHSLSRAATSRRGVVARAERANGRERVTARGASERPNGVRRERVGWGGRGHTALAAPRYSRRSRLRPNPGPVSERARAVARHATTTSAVSSTNTEPNRTRTEHEPVHRRRGSYCRLSVREGFPALGGAERPEPVTPDSDSIRSSGRPTRAATGPGGPTHARPG